MGPWRTWPRIVPYLRPYLRLVVLSFVLLIVLASVSALAKPWPLALVIDHVHRHRSAAAVLPTLFGQTPTSTGCSGFIVGLGFLIVIVSHGVEVAERLRQREDRAEHGAGPAQRHVRALPSACRWPTTTAPHRPADEPDQHARPRRSGSIVMAFPPLARELLTLVGMLVDRVADRLAGRRSSR